MEFKVKGVTFENEDGKDIQKIIKKELRELQENGLIGEKYEGYSNSEIKEMDLNVQEYSDVSFNVKVKEDVFEEKACVKIYIEKLDGDYVHVGYMPKKLLKEYNQFKHDGDEIIGVAELTGGRYKHCIYYEEDYEEKEEVETVELDYGLLVKLNIENHKMSEQQEKKQRKTGIERIYKEITTNSFQEDGKKKNINKKKNSERAIPYIMIGIICIPFIWILYKIFSFFIWLFE